MIKYIFDRFLELRYIFLQFYHHRSFFMLGRKGRIRTCTFSIQSRAKLPFFHLPMYACELSPISNASIVFIFRFSSGLAARSLQSIVVSRRFPRPRVQRTFQIWLAAPNPDSICRVCQDTPRRHCADYRPSSCQR